VSIGKRLIDLARSELNSLLDRAADLDEEDDAPPGEAAAPAANAGRGRRVRLEDLSDAELEAEIERRRLDREMDARARQRPSAPPPPNSGRTSGRDGHRPPPRPSGHGDPIARAYASLEVKPGSDFDTVRRAYRNMMRKYHPDRHTASPEKQKAANELAQKLTDAYKTLERHLRR
jgi:DnaJ-domain-containing protein 1